MPFPWNQYRSSVEYFQFFFPLILLNAYVIRSFECSIGIVYFIIFFNSRYVQILLHFESYVLIYNIIEAILYVRFFINKYRKRDVQRIHWKKKKFLRTVRGHCSVEWWGWFMRQIAKRKTKQIIFIQNRISMEYFSLFGNKLWYYIDEYFQRLDERNVRFVTRDLWQFGGGSSVRFSKRIRFLSLQDRNIFNAAARSRTQYNIQKRCNYKIGSNHFFFILLLIPCIFL